MRFSRLASDEQKLGRQFLCAGRWHRERCGQNGSVKSATLEEQINRDLVARAPSCSPRPLGRLTPGPEETIGVSSHLRQSAFALHS